MFCHLNSHFRSVKYYNYRIIVVKTDKPSKKRWHRQSIPSQTLVNEINQELAMGDKIMPQMTQMHFFESETRALLPTPNICWNINVLQVCSTHFVFIYIPSWSWGMVSPYPVNCMITVQMGFVESFHIEISWPVTCGSRGTPHENVCDVAPWCDSFHKT